MTDSSSTVTTHEWTAHYDDSGDMYYYNDKSGESSWEVPAKGFNPAAEVKAAEVEVEVEAATKAATETETETATKAATSNNDESTKQKKWVKHEDDDGQEYYYNNQTAETQWDRPEEYLESDNGKEKEEADERSQASATIKINGEADADPSLEDLGNTDLSAVVTVVVSGEKQPDKVEPPGTELSPAAATAVTATATVKTGKPIIIWTKHTDDEGQHYYYNEETEETIWDKPDDYIEISEGADEPMEDAEVTGTAPQDETAISSEWGEEPSAAMPEETNGTDDDDENGEQPNEEACDDNKSSEEWGQEGAAKDPSEEKKEEVPDSKTSGTTKTKWIEHTDDDDRVYYFNEETEETQWDKPSDFVVKEEGKSALKWTKHTDDDGQVYYYNEESEETQWDKPHDFDEEETTLLQEDNEGDGASPVRASSPIDTTSPAGTPEYMEPPPDTTEEMEEEEEEKAKPAACWTKHTDDEGREYYYNEGSGETQWDAPEGLVETAVAIAVAATQTAAASNKWTKHVDDERREYYYNASSGETQWDVPSDYTEEINTAETDKDSTKEKQGEVTLSDAMETDVVAAEMTVADTPKEPEPEPEPKIDPAVKKLQDAENALNLPDAIMEPGCLDNVGELVSSLGREGGAKAFKSLVDSFHGQTAMCGLLGLWLADLKAASDEVEPSKAANHVRDSAEDVINKIAKDKFTPEAGHSILSLNKSQAAFLEEMMDSTLWRKLLIDLSATHRDSQLLSYCLSGISKRGHHREIAKRINQSDHFPVYTAMLASEFTVVGNGGEAMGMHELLDDLRRTCTSTSYTYLYAIEVLRYLVHSAEERASSDPSLNQAIRKWTRLKEELEEAMVDPSLSSKTAGSSSLYRKRRRDVALTISELHQRQRRRLRPGGLDEHGDLHDEQKDALELTLSKLLLRHAEGKKFDDPMLEQLLSQGSNPKEVGRLMNSHPLVIKALLGHLFLPGGSRVSSFTTRSKCAQLIAVAVLAAESATKMERRFEDPATRQSKNDSIKESLLTGSQMCELVENMVSFAVTADIEIKKGSNPSAGVKLCVLANNSSPIAQGVVMWAKELVAGNEFVSSASYPTLAPNILSLLRIISTRHPFTRSYVLDIVFDFLSHSNRELSYQKMNEIREQALRMLLFLLVQGEVCSVLGRITQRLTKSGSFELDASLVRYFVGGLLDVIAPPCSSLLVSAMGNLLLTDKCVEALQSTYFSQDKKKKLQTLLGMIKIALPASSNKGRAKEVCTMVDALMKTYVVLKQDTVKS